MKIVLIYRFLMIFDIQQGILYNFSFGTCFISSNCMSFLPRAEFQPHLTHFNDDLVFDAQKSPYFQRFFLILKIPPVLNFLPLMS